MLLRGIRRKELRNGLQLADDDIIRGGSGLVTEMKKKYMYAFCCSFRENRQSSALKVRQ